jgi:hypothetical protein
LKKYSAETRVDTDDKNAYTRGTRLTSKIMLGRAKGSCDSSIHTPALLNLLRMDSITIVLNAQLASPRLTQTVVLTFIDTDQEGPRHKDGRLLMHRAPAKIPPSLEY